MVRRGWHHREYLPHFDGEGFIQHVVFRLVDSLPSEIMMAVAERDDPRRRASIEAALDRGLGSALLSNAAAAQVVADALRWFDGERYRLHAWCVMPNHVHAIVQPMGDHELGAIVSWKAFSATRVNHVLGRRGSLWARDYFDRFMRNGEQLSTTVAYVENNPVTAGLCTAAGDWPFSSAHERLPKSEPEGSRSE